MKLEDKIPLPDGTYTVLTEDIEPNDDINKELVADGCNAFGFDTYVMLLDSEGNVISGEAEENDSEHLEEGCVQHARYYTEAEARIAHVELVKSIKQYGYPPFFGLIASRQK